MDSVLYAPLLAHFVSHALLEEFVLYARQVLLETLVLSVQLATIIILMLQRAGLVRL